MQPTNVPTPSTPPVLDPAVERKSVSASPTPAAVFVILGLALASVAIPPLAGLLAVGLAIVVLAIATSASSRQVGRMVIVALLTLAVIRIADRQSPELLFGTVTAIALCMLPAVVWPIGRSSILPLPHLFGLLTAAYLLVGAVFANTPDALVPRVSDHARARGAVLTGLFCALIVIGMMLGRRYKTTKMVQRRVGDIEPGHSLTRFVILIVGGYATSILIAALRLRPSLGAIPALVDLIPLMGVLGVFAGWLRGQLGRRWLAVVLALVAGEVLVGIGSAAIYTAARAPISLLVLYIVIRRRVPWFVLCIAIMVALFLNTTKGAYRASVQADVRRGAAGNGLSYLAYFGKQANSIKGTDLSRAAARFSYSSSDLMGYVTERVPSDYGYWGATTYRNLPFTFIPRVLLPSKPTFTFGNQFGRQFGLLSRTDRYTAENIPLAVEAYVSFGYPGLIVVALAVGVLFSFVVRRLSDGTYFSAVVGTILVASLVQGVESDSTLVLGLLPLLGLTIPPILRWAAARS